MFTKLFDTRNRWLWLLFNWQLTVTDIVVICRNHSYCFFLD